MTMSMIVARMGRPYPIHEAKAKLSEILRRVKQGRSVTISDRGKEVARVVPVALPQSLDKRLDVLRRDGVLAAAQREPSAIQPIVRRPGALRRFLDSRE